MLIVDRTEDGVFLCDDGRGERLKLTADMCEGKVKSGDVLIRRNGKYRVSRRLTDKRRQELSKMQERLFNKP